MKNVIVFGSTGSIGVNALKVIKALKGRLRVIGLSANSNIELLKSQIAEFSPEIVAVSDAGSAASLRAKLKHKRFKILAGIDGLVELAAYKSADIVLMAISTSAALKPLLAAIDAKKSICLANKEALVMAGMIVTERARAKGVKIIPVDSEHSAIFQCLNTSSGAGGAGFIKNIYLTATGGPLRRLAASKMHLVPPHQALNHPKWPMGRKISVDSATMMNKGLEVIEARWLFGVDKDRIKILIHPEAVVHSMVEFLDGSCIAQLGITDMRLPIQYALTYPQRINAGLASLDFTQVKQLNFARPNFRKFPCLALAYEALKKDGTMPAVLNAANEELVAMFLDSKIRLTDIAKGVEGTMRKHKVVKNPNLNDILEADKWAREQILSSSCKQDAVYG